LVDDDQEDACWDERIRQRWTVHLLQHGKEMDMLPYSSPFSSPQQRGSRTKTSAQRKQKGKRRTRTGKTVSCNVGSGEKLIKEEAEDVCARLHSGIRLSVINEVNKDSTEEEDNEEWNQTDNETAINNEEASIGGGGISVPSPDNCKGCIVSGTRGGLLIDSQSSSDAVNGDGNDTAHPASADSTRTTTNYWLKWRLRMFAWGLTEKIGASTLTTTRTTIRTTLRYFEGPRSWPEEVWQV
jgi:hypothetical protein